MKHRYTVSSESNLLSFEAVPPRKPTTTKLKTDLTQAFFICYILYIPSFATSNHCWYNTCPCTRKIDQLLPRMSSSGRDATLVITAFSASLSIWNIPKAMSLFPKPAQKEYVVVKCPLPESRERSRWISRAFIWVEVLTGRLVWAGLWRHNRGVVLRFGIAAAVGQQRTLAVRGTQCR